LILRGFWESGMWSGKGRRDREELRAEEVLWMDGHIKCQVGEGEGLHDLRRAAGSSDRGMDAFEIQNNLSKNAHHIVPIMAKGTTCLQHLSIRSIGLRP